MTTSGVLMSETLPTIIGMGVVSKTTDTMFGKGGAARQAKYTRRTRSARTARATTRATTGKRLVHTGKRGGKYIMKNGRRVYI